MRSSSASISIAVHLAAVLAMAFLGAKAGERLAQSRPTVVPLVYRPPARYLGGGGQRQQLPASKGRLPPPPATNVFVPPLVLISNPKLPVSVALLDAPPDQRVEPFGDPLGKIGPLSGGRGGLGGIGDGLCCGIGDGKGPRAGATARVTGEVHPRYSSLPRLIYKVEPEYPDEARKSRYQGTVILSVDIDSSGNPANLRVMHGLGLGLDERALEAVRLWRFQPASAQGKPVGANVVVEVSFRLL